MKTAQCAEKLEIPKWDCLMGIVRTAGQCNFKHTKWLCKLCSCPHMQNCVVSAFLVCAFPFAILLLLFVCGHNNLSDINDSSVLVSWPKVASKSLSSVVTFAWWWCCIENKFPMEIKNNTAANTQQTIDDSKNCH